MAEDQRKIQHIDWDPGFSKLYIDTFERQTSENRFGPGAHGRIQQRLNAQALAWAADAEFDDSDDDDADDGDDDDNDEQDSNESEQTAGSGGHLDAGGEQSEASNTVSSGSARSTGKRKIPIISRRRINLTALSQHYDLYFAAYQNAIYVYQPQQALQILGRPLLVLSPEQSTVACQVGGHIDVDHHHQVNHLIVGELGNKEVLLYAFDDGDVVAYYTSAIATYCTRKQERQSQRTVPQPFFCDTVGKSAWGLAIHRQSRLIAVSSNLHEVTVFAFALKRKKSDRLETRVPTAESSNRPSQSLCVLEPRELETRLRSRERTWRILLPVGTDGSNLSSISFMDDEDGEAERIAAHDIFGTCWLLDIWRVGSTTIRLPPTSIHLPPLPRRHTGWGVLVLPLSSFLPTTCGLHCLGANPRAFPRLQREDCAKIIDTTSSLLNINENTSQLLIRDRLAVMETELGIPFIDPSPRIGEELELSDCEATDGRDVLVSDDSYARWHKVQVRNRHSDICKASIDFDLEAQHGYRQELIAVPNLGYSYRFDNKNQLLNILERSPDRKGQVTASTLGKVPVGSISPNLLKNWVILRTYDLSAELSTLDPRDPIVFCDKIVSEYMDGNDDGAPGWMDTYSEQLYMLLHVPELNLVVVGSSCGRVALLRLTRPPPGKLPRAGFRIEWILPRNSDEERGLRPRVSLVGLAVSPVREPGARGLDLAPAGGPGRADAPHRRPRLPAYPRRWRLLLHYVDHTILQYTIQAEEPRAEDSLIF